MKPDCRNHKKEVAGFSDMKVLAEMIGDLHYETLGILIDNVADKIFKDALKDYKGGRKQLSLSLRNASLYLKKSNIFIQEAWAISKPFMPAEKGEN